MIKFRGVYENDDIAHPESLASGETESCVDTLNIGDDEDASQSSEQQNEHNNDIYETEIEVTFQDDVFDNDESEQNNNENDVLFQDDILVDNEIDDIVNAEEEDYEFRQIKSHR